MTYKKLRCYSGLKEKICLYFLPCKDVPRDWKWEDWHSCEESLMVFATDYENLLLRYLKPVFPVIGPTSGEIQESIDLCSFNFIGKDVWENIIKNIKSDLASVSNNNEKNFYEEFVNWIEEQLAWADIIVVDGNL